MWCSPLDFETIRLSMVSINRSPNRGRKSSRLAFNYAWIPFVTSACWSFRDIVDLLSRVLFISSLSCLRTILGTGHQRISRARLILTGSIFDPARGIHRVHQRSVEQTGLYLKARVTAFSALQSRERGLCSHNDRICRGQVRDFLEVAGQQDCAIALLENSCLWYSCCIYDRKL
jgi:hypothetical protein